LTIGSTTGNQTASWSILGNYVSMKGYKETLINLINPLIITTLNQKQFVSCTVIILNVSDVSDCRLTFGSFWSKSCHSITRFI